MRRSIAVVTTLAVALTAIGTACSERATPVGVTLEDGQILVGDVTTATLRLDGALGTVALPLSDVGAVIPIEGRTLAQSKGHVTVWLRNGSEFRGEWLQPELDMGIQVGGEQVTVDLPTERVQALQLQGGEQWPEGDLFRVQTTHGDDFLVDAEASRVTLENELGTFSPFLSECLRIAPVGAATGDWEVVLQSGTVLVGPLAESELVFALPLGPDEVAVPLTALVALERGAWSVDTTLPPMGGEGSGRSQARRATPDNAYRGAAPPAKAQEAAAPALAADEGWFSYSALESAKR